MIDSYEHVVRPDWVPILLFLAAAWGGAAALAIARPRLRWVALLAGAAALVVVVTAVVRDIAPPGRR